MADRTQRQYYAVTLQVTSPTNPGFTETLLTSAKDEQEATENVTGAMIRREGGLSPALQITHVRTERVTPIADADAQAIERQQAEREATWQSTAMAARHNAELAATMRAAHLEALGEAQGHLRAAVSCLTRAEDASADWGERGSAGGFRMAVSEILSCDDDEAGLMPYIRQVAAKPRRQPRAR